jgi:hypothetical protein
MQPLSARDRRTPSPDSRPRLSRPQRWLVVAAIATCALGVAMAEQEPFSAQAMTMAIAESGWYTLQECPPSTVQERSMPGCAQIPTTVESAVEWLDRLDQAVFLETEREVEWKRERNLIFTIWHLVVTGQRYLLVLAPHPSLSATILYVSELHWRD